MQVSRSQGFFLLYNLRPPEFIETWVSSKEVLLLTYLNHIYKPYQFLIKLTFVVFNLGNHLKLRLDL